MEYWSTDILCGGNCIGRGGFEILTTLHVQEMTPVDPCLTLGLVRELVRPL